MEVGEKLKDEYLNSKVARVEEELQGFKEDLEMTPKPKQLMDYNRYLNTINILYNDVKDLQLCLDIRQIKQEIENYYDSLVRQHKKKEVVINDKFESLLSTKVEELKTAAKEHNKKIKDEFDSNNSIYINLENKRKKLEQYSEDIINMCSAYGVTTSDITVNNSSFTTDELNNLYDMYLDYIAKPSNRKNIISIFRERFDNIEFQASVLITFLVLAFTPVLNIIALVIFSAIIVKQIKVKNKMKNYAILLGLVYNIHPLELGFKNEIDFGLLEIENINEEEDSRLNEITEEWQKELEVLDNTNPEEELRIERLWLVSNTNEINKEIEALTQKFEFNKGELMQKIKDQYSMVSRLFEEEKSKVKLLGEEVTNSRIFNTKFKLGLKDGIIEETKDLGLSNIVIRPNKDEQKMKIFLQVLLANAFMNVRGDSLSVIVYDPNKFGQDLVSFYRTELETLLVFKNDKLDETIEQLKTYAMKNMKEMRGKDINEFNTEADRVGRTTKEYKLLIVLSQPKVVEQDEALTEFMSYSAKLGVFVWLVSNKDLSDTVIFKVPFEGVNNPYPINVETFGSKVANTLVEAIENNKTEGLAWEDFINVAVPDSKMWTFSGDQFIELDPGFLEGDPTQFKGYTIGNEGDVHAIGVGGTGAGKSVFLNHLIATVTKKYSPRDLELWLVDFKCIEFTFYLPSEEFPYTLPHIKACLCTTDGDYAASVYKALKAESDRRYQIFAANGVKNLKEYNEKMRRNGDLDKVLPRTILINDEFQVIFEKADGRVLEQIVKDMTHISKIGRAAGVHLFFTSQSMNKTLSADILQQFTLRFALRCDEAVSMDVLGTKYASSIKEKNGYLYIRSQSDKSLEAQKRYRTPFIPNNVLQEHIKRLAIVAEEQNMPKHNLITYNEATIHPIKELDSFYEELYKKEVAIPDDGLIILGNRMAYSIENKAPDNIILTTNNNTHIMSAFGETVDLVNFYKQIMCNIRHFKNQAQVLCNSQVDDLHYLCEIDKDVSEEQLELSSSKTDIYTLFELFQTIYNNRVKVNMKEIPAYFILVGWDKAIGFGIDKDPSLAAEFSTLLQLCGEYNMHFIFINTAQGYIGSNIVNACKYHICGKCDEKSSFDLLSSNQGCKSFQSIKNGYIYIREGDNNVRRAKLYLSEQTREIKVKELIL